jgi:uncharacterized alkaline shock family protein YloU
VTSPTTAGRHIEPIDLGQVPAPAGVDPDPAEILARTVADTALGVSGVHRLGTPFGRAVDSVRRSAFGSGSYPGVSISQRDAGVAITVSLVVEYPANVTEVAETARTQIAHAVGQLHEHPVAVDVTITDVHGPFDTEPPAVEPAEPRTETKE